MGVWDYDLLLLWDLPDLLCLVVDDFSPVRAEFAKIDSIAKQQANGMRRPDAFKAWLDCISGIGIQTVCGFIGRRA